MRSTNNNSQSVLMDTIQNNFMAIQNSANTLGTGLAGIQDRMDRFDIYTDEARTDRDEAREGRARPRHPSATALCKPPPPSGTAK